MIFADAVPASQRPARLMQALSDLVREAESAIDSAGDLAALDAIRVSYLGKNGELTARLKKLSKLPADERPGQVRRLTRPSGRSRSR